MSAPAPTSGDHRPGTLHRVFSFGTLLDEKVQRHVFGRTLTTEPDALLGHEFTDVVIDDPEVVAASGLAVHRGLARRRDSTVEGAVLALTDAELRQADAYEVSAYARRRVRTAHHPNAWAYLDARPLAGAERIAVVGDSLTSGRSDRSCGWAPIFAAAHAGHNPVRNRFFDLTAPGSTVDEVLRAGLVRALDRAPDTVIVSVGVTELIPHPGHPAATAGDVVAGLEKIAAAIESHGARVVVLGPLRHDEQHAREALGVDLPRGSVLEFERVLTAWSARTYRDLIPIGAVLDRRPDLLLDGLHPTGDGHALLARHLLGSGAIVS